jgi:hypothetical protein
VKSDILDFKILNSVVLKSQVLEETGYNLASQIDPQNVIEMSIKEQKISLFIVPGVPEDYPFKTKTRKEISVWSFLTNYEMLI